MAGVRRAPAIVLAMTRMTPLSNSLHGNMGWTPHLSKPAQGASSVVRLCLDEVPIFAIRMPVVFRVASGRAQPVIPVGVLQAGETALVGTGGDWRPRAVPFDLRRGPFEVLRTEGRDVVYVDEEKLVSSAAAKAPLFDGKGALHAETAAHLSQLSAWGRSFRSAERAATLLLQAELLSAWPKGGAGLYVVASDRLGAVAGETLAKLHADGALRLAHASDLSLGMIEARPVAANNARSSTVAPEDTAFLKALREEFS